MTEDEFPENEALNVIGYVQQQQQHFPQACKPPAQFSNNQINSEFTENIKGHHHHEVADDVIQGETSNRGNKLLYGAQKVHRDRIDGLNNDNDDIEEVEYNRTRRTVFKRRRLDTYNLIKKHKTEEFEELSDEEQEVYNEIDIESILAPITNPTDLITRPSIANTYNNDVLKRLAQQSIEIIEKEQFFVMKLSSLLDTFLGEGANQILEEDLQLPVYESILNDASESNGGEPNTTNNSTQIGVPSSQDQSISLANEIDPIEETKRITRRQSIQDPQDPFFALPQFKSAAKNINIDPELAERSRQLTTIALQRSEEYIRNLQNLRQSIVRAQRLKEKLQDYAREMNGDPDLADIYLIENPPAPPKEKAGKDKKNESGNETGGEGTEENASGKGKGRGGRRRGAQ